MQVSAILKHFPLSSPNLVYEEWPVGDGADGVQGRA